MPTSSILKNRVTARSATLLCGGRSSVAGFNTLPPLADPALGGVNFPGNPAPDLLPIDGVFHGGIVGTAWLQAVQIEKP